MVLEAFVSMLYNAALLLSLVVVFDVISRDAHTEKFWEQILAGFILGAITLGIMMNPWVMRPGVVFDTRTIFLSVGVMFFGVVPSVVSMLMALAYRLWMGGDGVVTGCSTIISSIAWGFIFRAIHRYWKKPYGFAEFYSLGILNHITMIALMLLMPADIRWMIVRTITLPVIIIYPLGTVLMGQLAARRIRRYEEQQKLQRSEEKYRLLTETSNDIILIRNLDGTIGFANRKAQELLGIMDEDINVVLAKDYVLPQYHELLEIHKQNRTNGDLSSKLFNLEIYDKQGKIHLVEVSSTPLIENGKLQGMLAALRDVTDRVQTEEQRNRYAFRLKILRELDGIVLETLSFDETCDQVLKKLQQLIPYDLLSINMLQDKKVELIKILKPVNRFEYLHNHQFHVPDMDFIEHLAKNRWQIVSSPEIKSTKMPVRSRMTQDGLQSFMYNALIVRDKLLGFLWFGSFQEDFFTDEHLEIALDFADQLAIVLNHISLIQTIREHSNELSRTVAARTAQLQNALDELEAFSYSVAHDLRSPLKLVHGYSEALAEDYAHHMDEEGRQLLGNIRSTAQRMDKLIMELLHLAKLSPDGIKAENFDMNELVQEIWFNLEHDGFVLDLHPLPSAWGDSTLLGQVWQNLLENAIKFSSVNSEKSIEVGCVFDDKELVYYVKDNGVGFAAEQAEEIFVPFKRLHNLESAEGSGIGLAISKKIILNHGGRIWAESKPDIGSTFYFSLPAMNEENNDQ